MIIILLHRQGRFQGFFPRGGTCGDQEQGTRGTTGNQNISSEINAGDKSGRKHKRLCAAVSPNTDEKFL